MPRKPQNNRFEVARILEKAILTGQLRPGVRLPEMRLAEEMGVSQASVREALQDLEGLGLVRKVPNRGSVVTRLTEDDLAHIYQIRRELEPLAASLAAAQMTALTHSELQGCVAAMGAAATAADFQAFSAADVRFHRLLWQRQPNRFLERALLAACLPLFAFDLIRRHASPQLDFSRAIRQHQLLLNALRLRDAALVDRIMRRMVDRWLRQDLADYGFLQDGAPPSVGASGPALPLLNHPAADST